MNETNHQSLVDVSVSIPDSVICLLSALAYYDLTTVKPIEVSVAIGKTRKVTKPEFPPVKLYYFSCKHFQ